jgi:putative ABC transport system permease protein
VRNLLIASRNLLRHTRKTFVVLSGLVIGLAGMVVFQGFLGEMMRVFRDGTILSGLGHLQLAGGEGYFEDGEYDPYGYVLKDSAVLAARIGREPGVAAAFPSVGFIAVAGFGDISTSLLVRGYPPERMYFSPAKAVAQAPIDRFTLGALVAGAPIEKGERDRLVLGESSARILGARIGDVITAMTVLPGGRLAGRDLTVSAIFAAPGLDGTFAFMDYDSASDFIGIAGPPVLDVLLKDISSTDEIERSLPKEIAHRGWKDLATLYVQVNTILSSFLNFIRAIILLVTLFILANSMNRIVRERMREWGTLRAMGTRRKDILLIVVLEGCLQGMVGSALGIALGFAVAGVIDAVGGLHFSSGAQTYLIMVHPGIASIWLNLIPATLAAGLVSILPGVKALRLTPAECLRQE